MNRPILTQTWNDLTVTAPATGAAAVPLDPTGNQNQLINAFALSIPTGGVNCFLVGRAIAAASGLELIAGSGPVKFFIDDERMLNELIRPMHLMAQILGCKPFEREDVPLVVWDLSQVYIVSSGAAQLVDIVTFKMPFV
jgi:hypothetical protein